MSHEPRTGNPGGRGIEKTAADIDERIRRTATLTRQHLSAEAIAYRLGVSARTVQRYRARLRETP
ncbi:HTH domain-containing protein [Streptosporangiaceae bacterium NEAU-GS5]|nr:HTH domain-containing protein [Streptosporangiaceae bacterium NEAU-GS5]